MSNLKNSITMKKILSIAMICTAMVLFCIEAPAPEGFKYQIIAYVTGLILFGTGAFILNKKEARR